MSAPVFSALHLLALCIAASVVIRRWEGGTRTHWWTGAVFGVVAMIVMLYPGGHGEIAGLDGQTAAIGLAGLYGGPVAAAVAGGIAAVCALTSLDAGLAECLAGIAIAAVFGGAGYYRWRALIRPNPALHTWTLALGMHSCILLAAAVLSPERGPLGMEAYVRALLFYPVAMALAGAALNDERYLARRAQRFYDVFDQQFQFMAILAPDGRLLEINDLPLRLAGGNREELLGQYFWDTRWWRDLPDMQSNWPVRLRQAAESEGPVFSLDQYRDATGSVRVADATITAVKDRNGAVQYFIVQASDVTDRLKTEEELKHRENLLRIAGKTARVGGWTLTLADGQVTWSEEIYKICELPPDFEPNLDAGLDAYLPESREQLSKAVQACIADGTPYDLELQMTTGRGRHIHVRAIGEAVRDGTGKVATLQGALQDITEAVAASRELREVTARLRGILEFSPLFIAVLDLDGRYLVANSAHDNLSGRAMEGKTLREILPEAKASQYLQQIREVAETREPRTIEDRIEIDGEAHFLNTVLFPLVDSCGSVTTVGGIAMEITDSKRAEAEREKLLEQLHQSQKMEAVGRLAGGVAHDFNNMLGVIIGNAEMALGKLEGEDPIRADLVEIQTAAGRSTELTRQLLAFARRQTIAPRVLQLNYVVESMQKMLGRLIGENIDLLWKPGSDLWPVFIDPTQVDQILANLAVNARDAIGEAGKLTIETATAAFDEEYCAQHPGFVPGRYVMLAVSDDGCGMTQEVREQAFEPFFTTKPAGEGTGLGLATVYGIVKQNGGFVNVYSEPGRGTTIRIYFPSSDASIESIAPESVAAKLPGGHETILLVEDEPALLALGQRQLELIGYNVLPAATPQEALDMAEEYADDIHLLMTDVIMPEMDGKELSRRLCIVRPDIKVLFVSGYTADTIAHRGVLDAGVYFLQKPFTARNIAAKIREVLSGSSGGGPG